MTEDRRRLLAELALVAVASVWGATFVMVKDAIERLPTMAFLGYRFSAAAVIVALAFAAPLRRLGRAGWVAGLSMGAFLTAGYILQTLGLERTSASNAGFITGLFVVLTPLLAAVFLRERITPAAWGAAVVSALGLYLLAGVATGFEPRGDGLVLLCAFAFAGHILVTGRAVRDHDPGPLLAVQLAVCGAFCLLVGAAAGDLETPRGFAVWSALVVTAVLASALGYFVQSYAQRHAPPARTALILASEPVFAGLFGWLLADERLPTTGLIGAALILAAIVAVELIARRPAAAVPGPHP